MAHPQRDSDPWRTHVKGQEKGGNERAAVTNHSALVTTPLLPMPLIASLKRLSITCGDNEARRRGIWRSEVEPGSEAEETHTN